MEKTFRYQHLRSLFGDVKPSVDVIREGEIAVNLCANKEKMFIKNSDNEIVSFIPEQQIDEKISTKADKSTTYTKTEVDEKFQNLDCGFY